MQKLRAIRNCLLLCHDQRIIDDEEFVLLYDLNQSKNSDFIYWRYSSFDLDESSKAECKAEFRFRKTDICTLQELLGIPDEVKCCNRLSVNGTEALCILLKRF